MTEEQGKRLMDAAHFALGWIIAKDGLGCDAAYFLASALKECGSESTYVSEIVKRQCEDKKKDCP